MKCSCGNRKCLCDENKTIIFVGKDRYSVSEVEDTELGKQLNEIKKIIQEKY